MICELYELATLVVDQLRDGVALGGDPTGAIARIGQVEEQVLDRDRFRRGHVGEYAQVVLSSASWYWS